MTDEPKYRTITLTNRPPVRIREDQWPLIAHGSSCYFAGEFEAQADRKWQADIRVRQHSDGRVIVYGTYDYTTQWQGEKGESHRVGSLLGPSTDLPIAINDAAAELMERVSDDDMPRHIREAADDCIADLPAEEL